MNTPIFDFAKTYANDDFTRAHMPGHKGKSFLGAESTDITEFDGISSLYDDGGVIAQSEENAAEIFKVKKTVYSTEGSSLCIKAMVYQLLLHRKDYMSRTIFCARNAHKAFICAAALCDVDVKWLYPENESTFISCEISAKLLQSELENADEKPFAVYITSPDYLGKVADIAGLSDVCHRFGVPLVVDNAHGAYLSFLGLHPCNLGADMCCDSAHKTLPCLTGGAYLHINNSDYIDGIKDAMALFGSTSPSHLVLQSLDLVNRYLCDNYTQMLHDTINRINKIKQKFFFIEKTEPLKIVINANRAGYFGEDLNEYLKANKIMCEYYDSTYVVLMLTPENDESDFLRISSALCAIEAKPEINEKPPKAPLLKQRLSIRKAVFSPSEYTKVKDSVGKICADVTVSCPPAVPIAVSGEVIDKKCAEALLYYKTEYINTVKEPDAH